jgi:hypothetical protein
VGNKCQFGPFLFDARERLLTRDARLVTLTPKAFDLLAALVNRPGTLVTKDELLREVWPDTFSALKNPTWPITFLPCAKLLARRGRPQSSSRPSLNAVTVSPLR